MLAKRIVTCLKDLRIDFECLKKRKKINARATKTFKLQDNSIRDSYNKLWAPLTRHPDYFYSWIYSNINGLVSPAYVPENLYYKRIEPTLNNRAFALAYADKNFYSRYVDDKSILPEILLRGVSGTVYSADFTPVCGESSIVQCLPKNRDLILKPATDSAGGSGVISLTVISDSVLIIDQAETDSKDFRTFLQKEYSNGFVIQERVLQQPWFSVFNKSSVNTIRMMTFRSPLSEKVFSLRSVLRFGRQGSLVDNQASGGLSSGVSDQGIVNNFSIDKYGEKTELNLEERIVPGFEEMKVIAVKIASKFYYHRLLGFDFCVDDQRRVRLLEINTKNLEINFIQMNLGPLFREYTREVIGFCQNHPRTIVLDYWL